MFLIPMRECLNHTPSQVELVPCEWRPVLDQIYESHNLFWSRVERQPLCLQETDRFPIGCFPQLDPLLHVRNFGRLTAHSCIEMMWYFNEPKPNNLSWVEVVSSTRIHHNGFHLFFVIPKVNIASTNSVLNNTVINTFSLFCCCGVSRVILLYSQ